jgi:hypothetical protein
MELVAKADVERVLPAKMYLPYPAHKFDDENAETTSKELWTWPNGEEWTEEHSRELALHLGRQGAEYLVDVYAANRMPDYDHYRRHNAYLKKRDDVPDNGQKNAARFDLVFYDFGMMLSHDLPLEETLYPRNGHAQWARKIFLFDEPETQRSAFGFGKQKNLLKKYYLK